MISKQTCCISPAGKILGNIAPFLSQHLVFLPSRDSLALQKRQQNPKNFPPCRAGKSMCSSGEQVHDQKPCTCSSRPHPHPLLTGYPLMWYLHDFEFFDDLWAESLKCIEFEFNVHSTYPRDSDYSESLTQKLNCDI